MSKVMIAVKEETKLKFRNLQWPSYVTTDEARINFIIEHMVFNQEVLNKYLD